MPNSSGGQQEVEQQEEEGEVGEGAREQEFGQQDEERVVKRRITVSRRPTIRKKSERFRYFLQECSLLEESQELESYLVPVKVNTVEQMI